MHLGVPILLPQNTDSSSVPPTTDSIQILPRCSPIRSDFRLRSAPSPLLLPLSKLRLAINPVYSVLCSNKALLDTIPSLSVSIRPVVRAGTCIALFQNGVGAEGPLHEAFPGNTVISAVVSALLGNAARVKS